MNINNLWEAIGMIDDKLLNDAIDIKKRSRYSVHHWWFGVTAAIIIVIISFSTAYTVSAQFREWVISLFQIKETEIVPSSEKSENKIPESSDRTNSFPEKENISLYAADTIEDVFDVQYLKSTNFMSTIGPVYTYSDASGSTKYYVAENSKFVPVETDIIKSKVKLLGITGMIDYTRINYNGNLLLQQNGDTRFMLADGNDAVFLLGVSGSSEVWLTLYKNPQSDKWAYPAKYNLETGKVSDILKGISVDGIELKKYPVLRNWNNIGEGVFVVSLGKTLESAEAYMIDINKKISVSLSKLTGLPMVSSAKVVDGKIMLFEPLSNDKFNYYCYDYSMNTVTEIFKNAAYWSSVEPGDNCLRVEFSGGRYDFIEEKGNIYLTDEFSGTRITVEGITEELAENLIINSDNNKILVSSFGNNVIKQFGIIDIKAGRFYLMSRKNQDDVIEKSIAWYDDNHIIIEAENNTSTESYVYLYSLIEKR